MTNISIFKKVLFIGPNYIDHKGGIGAVLMVYQKWIPDFNFIATYDGNFSTFKNILLFIKSFKSLVSILLSNNNIEIIHIHGASKGSFWRKYFIFIVAKYLFRKKIIYHVHGGKFHLFYKNSNYLKKLFINHFIHHSDHIICLSKSWKAFFISLFDVRSISIINNPIEIPNHLLERSDKTCLSLLFLGKVGENKGVFDLLSVLVKKRSQYIGKLKLKIGGDGEIDKLKDYIESEKLHDIVEYVGWVNGDLKNNLLSECDVLILPSYNEGLPISILEAMSYRKAIISTTVGGIPEVVKDGKNGFLIEPGDIKMLEKHLDWMLSNIDKLPKMGIISSNLIVDYDINEVLSQLNKLYIKILN